MARALQPPSLWHCLSAPSCPPVPAPCEGLLHSAYTADAVWTPGAPRVHRRPLLPAPHRPCGDPGMLVGKHEGNTSFEDPSFVAKALGRGTSAFSFGIVVL